MVSKCLMKDCNFTLCVCMCVSYLVYCSVVFQLSRTAAELVGELREGTQEECLAVRSGNKGEKRTTSMLLKTCK